MHKVPVRVEPTNGLDPFTVQVDAHKVDRYIRQCNAGSATAWALDR